MGTRIQNVKQQDWNGLHFRSSLEAQTAKVLKQLDIPFKYEERKLVLQDGFRSPFQKDKVRAVTYTPDFEIGHIILECKGFETPEWKIKKKLLFKYLMDNEPETLFYQIHDAKKSLLEVLDRHWKELGYIIQVTEKPTKKLTFEPSYFESIHQAVDTLNLKCRSIGVILSSLTGNKEYILGYKWKIINIKN